MPIWPCSGTHESRSPTISSVGIRSRFQVRSRSSIRALSSGPKMSVSPPAGHMGAMALTHASTAGATRLVQPPKLAPVTPMAPGSAGSRARAWSTRKGTSPCRSTPIRRIEGMGAVPLRPASTSHDVLPAWSAETTR